MFQVGNVWAFASEDVGFELVDDMFHMTLEYFGGSVFGQGSESNDVLCREQF
jgi:hypothetical protein